MTSSRIFLLVPFASALALATAIAACSSDDATTTTPATDAGTSPDGAIDPTDAGCTRAPPTGLTQLVAPAPDTSEADTGRSVVMTLDASGNPVVAYLDGISTARVLMTMRWDPCTGAWTTPVQLDAVGTIDNKSTLSIATDATDGRIAIAYAKAVVIAQPNGTLTANVALSTDGGKTFTTKKISTHKVETGMASGDADDIDSPVIALAKGKTFVAYNQDEVACNTDGTGCQGGATLATSSDGVTYTQEVLSDGVGPGGHLVARAELHPGIATDSTGAVAVVMHQAPDTGYNTGVMFCRSGKTCVKVLDSNNAQNDYGASSLAFTGTKAHITTNIQRDSSGSYDFLYATSDDGTVWSAPSMIPRDGDSKTTQLGQSYLTPNGANGVILLASASDGTTAQYGAPKIFTSGATWTISAATPLSSTQPYGGFPTGRVAANGKLMLTFQGTSPTTSNFTGVTFWSQP